MQITAAALTLLVSLVGLSQAFEMTFPNNNGGYWVTNYTNTLVANSSDPALFSVQLLNLNESQLNGNFQIGNALNTANGSAQIFIDRIPSGTYTVLFVNSSNYELDHAQVYYTSSSFEVRPNGTQPAQVTANTNADPNSSATQAATGSANATTLSSATGRPSRPGSNGAMGMVQGSTAAIVGSVASVVLGLGIALLA
ncbi:hypothetical protein NDA13_003018 [Ustilago tritici]|nr:hypothetical protein NDA13_003018 [Ustilago tritici]